MTPVNLNAERWNLLIAEAHRAVETGDMQPLEKRASAMREAPSPIEGAGRAACNTFRWACLWFAHAEPGARLGLRPMLLSIAAQVEQLLTPAEPEPGAAVMAVPVDLFAEPEPAWAQRRDIGG